MTSASLTPPVTVGIVTWNSAGDLPACLRAVHSQTYADVELIVIDNDSDDDSVSLVTERAPEASIVRFDRNRGYGAAHNRAIEAANGDYYLALNPDVVMEPNYVSALVGALESRPKCGSAMGKLWLAGSSAGSESLLDGTGLFIDRRRHQYLRGHGEPDKGQFDTAGEIFGVDGAAPLYRIDALRDLKVQGQVFDEGYFIHMEDVDLAWRARLLGWSAWYEPEAVATHDRTFRPGARTPMPEVRRRDSVKNRYLTICKNEAPETWRRDWWRILAYDARIFAYVLLLEQSSLGAYRTLFNRRQVIRRSRTAIWSRARALPEERRRWFG